MNETILARVTMTLFDDKGKEQSTTFEIGRTKAPGYFLRGMGTTTWTTEIVCDDARAMTFGLLSIAERIRESAMIALDMLDTGEIRPAALPPLKIVG